jgi:thiol:disulfide interchange protein DsbD
MSILKFTLLLVLNAFVSSSLFADEDFLPVDEAFKIDVTVAGPGLIRAHWEIADHYYLYRDRMSFKPGDEQTVVGEPNFPEAEQKYDENFGKTMFIYHKSVDVEIPVSSTAKSAVVSIRWQGCAEAGLCYPPITRKFTLDVPAGTTPVKAAMAASDDSAFAKADDVEETEESALTKYLQGNAVIMFFAFLVFGILLALTPCVLPMVPILSTIITGQDELSPRKAFILSLTYVLAMAFTFALAGAGVGAAGAAALQSPTVLGVFSGILVLLSLSMFGLYKLALPEVMQTKLTAFSNKQEGGNLIGVAIMGSLSALIVGPCVTAPAAAALLFIAETGSYVIGFFALLGLGLGMGIPILAIGTVAGSLVPKAGTWMIRVQHIFGFIILGMAIYLISRVMNPTLVIFFTGLLLVGFGVYCNAFDHDSEKEPGWHTFFKTLGLASVVWGILLLFATASGGTSLLQPLSGFGGGSGVVAQQAEPFHFKTVSSIEELDAEVAKAATAGKPVMFDFYATWCTACKEYEHITFPHPTVTPLLDKMVLLKVDVSDQTDADKALQDRFRIVGPPSLVFFDANGNELPNAKLVGYKNPEAFVAHLNKRVFSK